MASEFLAGYISGSASILIGSPLDIIKTRLQSSPATSTISPASFPTFRSLLSGTAAPVLTYGALNAVLYSAYSSSLSALSGFPFPFPFPFPSSSPHTSTTPPSLTIVFTAGALAGLTTFFISTPTELIKVRTQVGQGPSISTPQSSVTVARSLLAIHGIRGLYIGGCVTALRDAIGYGWYFHAYEACRRTEGWAGSVLVAGGIAGCVTWASVYPLDVVKTRVQTQIDSEPLLGEGRKWHGGMGSWGCARAAYRQGGFSVFFDGLGVCMARAFVVNAVQWAIYEYIIRKVRKSTIHATPAQI